jgi:dihydrofolate reductase
MVASLDFFIARKDNSVSWLETSDRYDKGATFENAEEFMKSIGCYVMGSRTYEHALVLGWPYGDVPTIVLTHRTLPRQRPSVELYSGELNELVNGRLKPRYKSIWVVGGAAVAADFIRSNLVDDIRLMVAPILLGDGTRFVEQIGREQALHLKDATAYQNGMVELWYEVKK